MATRRSASFYSSKHQLNQNWSQDSHNSSPPAFTSKRFHSTLRKTNAERSLIKKKRIIKMLLAVVLEFFICWTPLYVINTIVLFNPAAIYNYLGYTGISFFQLLAFTSSCCNPITYCFMNRGFRKSFMHLFRCCRCSTNSTNRTPNGSDFNMAVTKFSSKMTEPSYVNWKLKITDSINLKWACVFHNKFIVCDQKQVNIWNSNGVLNKIKFMCLDVVLMFKQLLCP